MWPRDELAWEEEGKGVGVTGREKGLRDECRPRGGTDDKDVWCVVRDERVGPRETGDGAFVRSVSRLFTNGCGKAGKEDGGRLSCPCPCPCPCRICEGKGGYGSSACRVRRVLA